MRSADGARRTARGRIALGVVMVGTPAEPRRRVVNHLWNHLKPKADKRYVNESELLWASWTAPPGRSLGATA